MCGTSVSIRNIREYFRTWTSTWSATDLSSKHISSCSSRLLFHVGRLCVLFPEVLVICAQSIVQYALWLTFSAYYQRSSHQYVYGLNYIIIFRGRYCHEHCDNCTNHCIMHGHSRILYKLNIVTVVRVINGKYAYRGVVLPYIGPCNLFNG